MLDNIMDSCDTRTRAYKNGKTFDQCKKIAEKKNHQLQKIIDQKEKITWNELLEKVDHDELVYKLTLKFLRLDGYDIGNNKRPEIKKQILES
jgi:hypothetical protein